MGMFDSVYVNCPKCGELVEFQSKAGDCTMSSYTIRDADTPPGILGDLKDAQKICKSCGWTVVIRETIRAYIETPEEAEK